MITIKNKKKCDLFPYFGKAFSDTREVWIREDLPTTIKYSLILHEVFHIDDKAKGLIWREVKAISLGQVLYPLIGFFYTIYKSMTKARLTAYYRRYIK
jgi:hypothetical protein